MAKIKLSAVNEYVRSIYNQVDLSGLVNTHAATIRAWFIANMSKIGRYSNRDFERFGNLYSTNSADKNQQGRQDGWVSVTEEVPDVDQLTYGTGILYIHGEMEVPGKGAAVQNDSYRQCDASGGVEHFEVVVSSSDGAFTGSDESPIAGFSWNWETVPSETYTYSKIIQNVAGINVSNSTEKPSATSTTPAVFNDDAVYHLDNERNNYPLIIINSSAPESINRLLSNNIDRKRGMYDGSLPSISKGSFPPKNGISVDADNRKIILDFISPAKSI